MQIAIKNKDDNTITNFSFNLKKNGTKEKKIKAIAKKLKIENYEIIENYKRPIEDEKQMAKDRLSKIFKTIENDLVVEFLAFGFFDASRTDKDNISSLIFVENDTYHIKKADNERRNNYYCLRFNEDEMNLIKKYMSKKKTVKKRSVIFRDIILSKVAK